MDIFIEPARRSVPLRGKKAQLNSQAVTVKRSLSHQIELEMYRSKLSKITMANRMGTSRAAVNRMLDPENTSITLSTLEKVAQALNKRLKIEFT